MSSRLDDVVLILGYAAVLVGLWMVAPWLALIVGGLVAMAIALTTGGS